MGDRANIFVVDQAPDSTGLVRGIYLYTHWMGCEFPEMLREALDQRPARDRWRDPAYLLRILVHDLFEEDRGGSTGSGISTFRIESQYPTIVLDTHNERVGFAAQGQEYSVHNWVHMKSFDEYVRQDLDSDYPEDLDAHWSEDMRPDMVITAHHEKEPE